MDFPFAMLTMEVAMAPQRAKRGNQVKSASSLRVPLSVVGERDIARGVTTGQERTEMSTVGVGPCDGAHSAHVLPQNTCIERDKIASVPFFV